MGRRPRPPYGPDMRRPLPTLAVLLALATGSLGAAPADIPPPLPYRLADTGGGSQLITAEAPGTGSTTGTVTWWERRGGRWVEKGSAPARFGANGLAEGAGREQGTGTTPTGLYDLPYAFGIEDAPAGTRYPYRKVNEDSWWCQDNASRAYNRWVEPRPDHCRAEEAEHLVTYGTQYARALVIGFNYDRPVRGRGAGIFLHVNGRGATAGCVSVPAEAMAEILAWVRPERRPHIAVGTSSGPTAITRY
ncbi:L,D-peptidoglycan transpeptidase YkuD, ErfK/YbiS/YcfS/YnhG family [Streptomyces sp. AmelKG-D3]|nr:L,D-peptidoglycan transpeptidase YkuD, ErfK/YbiS/YcfS/YnhG family [Streptomyces sp. AmelKG-D3]